MRPTRSLPTVLAALSPSAAYGDSTAPVPADGRPAELTFSTSGFGAPSARVELRALRASMEALLRAPLDLAEHGPR